MIDTLRFYQKILTLFKETDHSSKFNPLRNFTIHFTSTIQFSACQNKYYVQEYSFWRALKRCYALYYFSNTPTIDFSISHYLKKNICIQFIIIKRHRMQYYSLSLVLSLSLYLSLFLSLFLSLSLLLSLYTYIVLTYTDTQTEILTTDKS